MRVLLWVVMTAAGLWAGYWFVGSRAVERGAVQAFAQATAQGMVAQNEGVGVAGFPNRFDLTLTRPRLFDPASGYGWRASDLRLLAMTWKPWHLIALAPDESVINTPLGDIAVTASDLRGSLVLHPGADLTMRGTVIEAIDLAVSGASGPWSLAKASFATAEDNSRQNSHRIGLQVTDLIPSAKVSAALPDLPTVLSSLHLDGYVLLSAPLDRHVADTRPEVTGVIVKDARLDWGLLRVAAQGSLATVSDGTADGKIALQIQNWRLFPAVLGQFGVIDPVLAPTLLRALEIMAKGSPDIETTLTFKSGRASLGPLPVGRAPRLVYRQ